MYTELAANPPRNHLIATDIIEAARNGRPPLVLTQRADHVNLLAQALEQELPQVIRLTGKASAKEKREALQKLKAIPREEPLVIAATGQYVGEGFDEPRLDTLFLAAPVSWKGVLQQYTGRLHRVFENKRDVYVYDYVDVHINMLEKMYHKRSAGYNRMGYQVLSSGSASEKAGVIFDSHSFLPVFKNDIFTAMHEIIVVSPFLRKSRVEEMAGLLQTALDRGVRAVVVTRPADSYKPGEQNAVSANIQLMTERAIQVQTKPNIHQKFAVIDQQIVWYGSINLLSYGTVEESVMRLVNAGIAGELLEIVA